MKVIVIEDEIPAAGRLTSDGTLNGTIASFDCKTLVYYIDNAITPGDRLTYTLEK